MVIVSHAFIQPFGNETHEPLKAATNGQVTLGGLAVAGFFVVSGYLVGNSWLSSLDFRPYIAKRLLRVYPGYAVAVLLGLLVLGPVFSGLQYFRSFGAFDVIKAFLVFNGIPGVGFLQLPAHILNGTLWTIQYEFACYLALPLVLMVAGTRRWPVVVILLLILPLAALPMIREAPSIVLHYASRLHNSFVFASYFLSGAAMLLYAPRITVRRIILSLVLLVFGAAVPPFLAITLPICGAYLLLALALCTPELGRAFFKRFDLSYGTYLYGWPVGQLVLLALGAHAPPWLMVALTLPLTIVVAFGSWTLVERRFLLLKPRTMARPARPGTV